MIPMLRLQGLFLLVSCDALAGPGPARKPIESTVAFSKLADTALITGDFAKGEYEGLPFRIYGKPEMLKDGKKYPVVLLLHGAGEKGDDNEAQLKHGAKAFTEPANFAKHPCFLIVPQCPKDGWWGGAPLDKAKALIDAVTRKLPVDKKRVYVTGLSMGGFGTWELISKDPKYFAAAVPICGGGDPSRVVAAKGLPIWTFHGGADPTVPVQKTRELVEALKKAGSKTVRFTEYPGVAHNSWTRTYDDPKLMDWLFEQKR